MLSSAFPGVLPALGALSFDIFGMCVAARLGLDASEDVVVEMLFEACLVTFTRPFSIVSTSSSDYY